MRNWASQNSFYSTLVIGSVLAGLCLTGCSRDGSSGLAGSLLDPPPGVQAAKRDIERFAPRPTVQQTAFESDIVDPVWHDSYATAVAEAQQNDKLILADFTGSDWCHWCVKLKKDVFDTPEFKSWAGDNVVLLELDYPKSGSQSAAVRQQNELLKSRYNITSYPTVLLLDVAGNVRAKMGYEQGKSSSQWVQIAEAKLSQNGSNTRIATGNGGSTTR